MSNLIAVEYKSDARCLSYNFKQNFVTLLIMLLFISVLRRKKLVARKLGHNALVTILNSQETPFSFTAHPICGIMYKLKAEQLGEFPCNFWIRENEELLLHKIEH